MAVLGFLVLMTACASVDSGSNRGELAELQGLMTGTFSSSEQSKEDPENYFPIRLVMMPIWTDRADGPWLYVEQASEAKLDRPYRQRVYKLEVDTNGTTRSVVYTLPGNALDRMACWTKEDPLSDLVPSDLILRKGCAIYLSRGENEDFVGSTAGKGCASTLGGAAYATSEVVIAPGLLTSWDRGFDSDDQQKWGAELGAYKFVQTSKTTPNAK